jgi:predicted nucleic acid-binding protein
VFDTAPLITCCKFEVCGQPIIDHILDNGCSIVIPSVVQEEISAERHRYTDARLAEQQIHTGRIAVRDVTVPADNATALYNLGKGEQGAIALTFALADEIDYLVLDDKLAYIVSDRIELPKLFLLDLIVLLVEQEGMSKNLGKVVCQAVSSRYSVGLVTHTLRILERGERKWLK